MSRIPEHLRQDLDFVSSVVRSEQATQLETVAMPLRPPFLTVPIAYSAYDKALDSYSGEHKRQDFDPSPVEEALCERFKCLSYEDVLYISQMAIYDLWEIDHAEEIIETFSTLDS